MRSAERFSGGECGGECMVIQEPGVHSRAGALTGLVGQGCGLKQLDSDMGATADCFLSPFRSKDWLGDT